MAIKSNESTQEVVGGGIKLYSGLSNFNVIAVNPTMDELHKLALTGTAPQHSSSDQWEPSQRHIQIRWAEDEDKDLAARYEDKHVKYNTGFSCQV